jgi:hypothetical protein
MTKEKNAKLSRVLKWVGYLTAIFSLCATVAGVANYLYNRAEIKKNIASLLATESEELKSDDYSAGWRTLEKAAQLDPDSAKVRAAQEDLAMAWLENASLQENEKFSDITGKLEPVLTRAVASAKPGPRQADLRAHIGWAYFLESRDGRSDLDPTGAYREAVAEDPDNPYAQSMWGHWILWQNCRQVQEATTHFAAAIASQREGDFARRLEMSALLNCQNHPCHLEAVRVANDMRKERRSPDGRTRGLMLGIYFEEFNSNIAEKQEFINAVPPAEHVATFRWLFDALLISDATNQPSAAYYLGALEEAAGQPGDALANYRLAQRHISRDSAQGQAIDAGVKRLSRPQ